MGRWLIMLLAAGVAACAQGSEDDGHREDAAAGRAAPARPAAAPEGAEAGERDLNAVIAASTLYADSADRMLRRVPNLSRQERAQLRRDVNEVQVERARQMGVRVAAAVDPLVGDGSLVRVPDTTQYWIIRELDYSVPYVTPDALAMLIEIGSRFHARLDSLAVPRYRLDITSMLRTPQNQADLRRRNANASREESAHEFGTTVDLAYRRYAPPAAPLPMPPHGSIARHARMVHDSLVVETGRLRGAELQAVLGRVLRGMQQEGKLLVRMERRQTVYHITVARRLPRREIVALP